jgi:hypothetical protein
LIVLLLSGAWLWAQSELKLLPMPKSVKAGNARVMVRDLALQFNPDGADDQAVLAELRRVVGIPNAQTAKLELKLDRRGTENRGATSERRTQTPQKRTPST